MYFVLGDTDKQHIQSFRYDNVLENKYVMETQNKRVLCMFLI